MLAHRVDLVNARAAGQERVERRPRVVERQVLGEGRPERRPAARNEDDEQIVGAAAARRREGALGGAPTGFVGHRMPRLGQFDPARERRVARLIPVTVRNSDQPFGQPVAQLLLDRPRHPDGGLAHADDDDPGVVGERAPGQFAQRPAEQKTRGRDARQRRLEDAARVVNQSLELSGHLALPRKLVRLRPF
ncbi:MAG: hypothetical protein BWZ08_02622 [candidate division BRC1 bacterium ADurb.BinA292]|nr:MAG: hypothetical protein BWZ08_02622 [candidate division BRC1 bacterium ADurb.BinA292]